MEHHVVQAFPINLWVHLPGFIPHLGLLDLHHIGTVVGQKHSCIGTCDVAGEIQDLQPF